jgi:AcrR family transcriptional regulator
MRLTRKQTQEQTRNRLLDAAAEAIFADGLSALSIRAVCEAAGYSQGAFYSNFSSRDDLLLALMERHIEEEAANLSTLITGMGRGDLEQDMQAIARWLAEHGETEEWSRINADFKLHAQRDAEFAEGYRAAAEPFHRAFAVLMGDLVHRHGLRPILPARELSVGLYALWTGLALQRAVDPALPRQDIYLAFLRAAMIAPRASLSSPPKGNHS